LQTNYIHPAYGFSRNFDCRSAVDRSLSAGVAGV
jgi:hypothetical protein